MYFPFFEIDEFSLTYLCHSSSWLHCFSIFDLCSFQMNFFDIVKFCIDYPALVIAIILGVMLWSMVIMVALGGGRTAGQKSEWIPFTSPQWFLYFESKCRNFVYWFYSVSFLTAE